MRSFANVVAVLLLGGVAGAQSPPDLATDFNEAAAPKTVAVTATAFRSLSAVEGYRRTRQAKVLSLSELDVGNFTLHVREQPDADEDLSIEERRNCVVVVFRPLLRKGEPVVLDSTRTANGRTARYIVRKRDFAVVRMNFGQPTGIHQ